MADIFVLNFFCHSIDSFESISLMRGKELHIGANNIFLWLFKIFAWYIYIHIYMYICIYLYVYIYIEILRAMDRAEKREEKPRMGIIVRRCMAVRKGLRAKSTTWKRKCRGIVVVVVGVRRASNVWRNAISVPPFFFFYFLHAFLSPILR